MITVFGSVFQTAGAEHRKACFANVIVSHERSHKEQLAVAAACSE